MPATASFERLCELLGTSVGDRDSAELFEVTRATVGPDFVVAKEAGFDFSLARAADQKSGPKRLGALFLYAEGRDKHREYAGLPEPFVFGVTRQELLAIAPAPVRSFKIGKGTVAVDANQVDRDIWVLGDVELHSNYRGEDRRVAHYLVTKPSAQPARDLSASPLHFEKAPVDEPPGAALMGSALLLAWAVDRFGLANKHVNSELGKQLVAHKITPRTFLERACNKQLTSADVAPKVEDFLWGYTNALFAEDDAARSPKLDAAIKKLLGLKRSDDRRAYNDDFLATFASVLKSPFYVPDSWEAFERLAPVLDARWADYEATKFTTDPDLAIYQRAVKLRDARSVAPAKAASAASATPDGVDDSLAVELLGLVGKSLKDKDVRALLERLKLPIGKCIDEQANPALGVSYLGSNHKVGGKKVLAVTAVTFFADKQRSYVRGLGKEVVFRGYPAALPRGVKLGAARAAVRKVFGKPHESNTEMDWWFPSATRRIAAKYTKTDKLAHVNFGFPAEWLDPPKPPFTGVGVF